MIRQAAEAGADAIKFQTYKAETLASRYSPAYWDTRKEPTKSQYELFKKYDKFGEEEYEELARYARKHGIYFLSTPFDERAVDFLYDLVPAYKIASADITNIPFIKYIARKGKPIFLSTGASTIGEIEKAIRAIEEEGNEDIVLLHCILNYPTRYEDANLLMIKHLQKVFPKYLVGYSDHTLPDESMIVLTTAYLLGARVIEKHFTFDKTLPGNDHYHAMDFHDLKRFVENIKIVRKILGKEYKNFIESEIPARRYARRSLVATRDIPKGTVLTREMLTAKRPGTGISPEFLNIVIGKKAKRDIKEDEILNWDDIC
ncbi:MAG: N-acetylneuraminate synthase family protein [Candidatus Odinarchaeota archaeon]|nr:N-acetylneuraminate synthase family protein [Candidatus Odinarchaeota archaeon]